ncbi:MAG: radical SAM protein [Firmicutes bacterium]|nr:radical SAM protein [Bacillota bacterium]
MVTDVCNNNCVFCAAYNTEFPSITLSEIENIFSRGMGAQEVVISGKEPTTSDDLPEIVRRLAERGCSRITIQTNARRLSNIDFLKKFKGSPVTFFVSIHGYKAETHERLSGAPGSFAETMQGIRNIAAEGFNITTNTVITKMNMHELPALTEKLLQIGISCVTLAYVVPSGKITAMYEEYAPKYPEAIGYINESFSISEKYVGVGNIQGLPFCYLQGRESYANDAIYGDVNEIFAGDGTNFSGNESRSALYVKGDPCKACDYTLFCDGVFSAYVQNYEWNDIKPVKLEFSNDKKERKSIELKSGLYPAFVVRRIRPVHLVPRKFGGFFINTPLIIPLTKKGFLVLSSLSGNVNLKEISEKFGSEAVDFVADFYTKGLIILRKEKGDYWHLSGPPGFGENKFDINENFEIPIYGREISYPQVKLI